MVCRSQQVQDCAKQLQIAFMPICNMQNANPFNKIYSNHPMCRRAYAMHSIRFNSIRFVRPLKKQDEFNQKHQTHRNWKWQHSIKWIEMTVLTLMCVCLSLPLSLSVDCFCLCMCIFKIRLQFEFEAHSTGVCVCVRTFFYYGNFFTFCILLFTIKYPKRTI